MRRERAAVVLLAAAVSWLSIQASLLFRVEGILATYDLPAHQHLSSIQIRQSAGMWDDAWYAGHPTYSYPPLAHALAAKSMQLLGFDVGFKFAVAAVYVVSAAGLYAVARVLVGSQLTLAAVSTFACTLSPLLLRAFLFGQYSSLVAFPVYWGVVAAFFRLLRSERPNVRMYALAGLLIGILGSAHLFPLLMLPWVIIFLPVLFPTNRIIRRLGLPVLVGGALALLPSVALIFDRGYFVKVAVPHITRTEEMIRPGGLVDWVLAPAGLPMVLGSLVLLPALIPMRGGVWIGTLASLLLVIYIKPALAFPWLIISLTYVGLTAVIIATSVQDSSQRRVSAYLAIEALASIWLSVGPRGWLARLLPFADRLVFDRPLLFGAPFGYLALTHAIRGAVSLRGPRRYILVVWLLCGLTLLGFSTQRVLAKYSIVPGAQGGVPQGTSIPSDLLELLRRERSFGRALPLGLPPVYYILPELTGIPLIDGLYNDARQLTVLRYSGLETLGYEKYTYPDLRYTRFFLTNAEAYGIRWVITGDRHYDPAIPFELFALVDEWGDDPERSIRLYKSLIELQPAWSGPIKRMASNIAEITVDQLGPFQTGGGMLRAETFSSGSVLHVVLRGTAEPGWATVDLNLASQGQSCNQILFQAWSPTRASLIVKVLRRDRWLVARPEFPLGVTAQDVAVGLDCQQTPRIQIGLTGSGIHHVFITDIRVRQVRSATIWVPFERSGPECFRVFIPEFDRRVIVSLAYFHRWRSVYTTNQLRGSESELGLLRLEGPEGTQEVCLVFPFYARVFRALLPWVYLLALVPFLLSPWVRFSVVRVFRRTIAHPPHSN